MPEDSPQAQALISAARLLTRQANGGRGQVFAQIGLDALPCPEMCQYCSFAANSTALEARDVLSLDEVVAYARAFDAAGIHLVSLMATAACDFQRYLAITAAVRQVLQPSVPILANLGDLDAGQAQALRQAGANAIYHAVRLGEGSITNIDPTRRWQTISHASLAGLKLMTGVEPLYEQQQPQDVVNRMFETLRSGALCTGCCPLVPVVGTPLADAGCTPPTPQRRQLIGAIYRLVIGTSIPFGLGGISWVDAGTNPRGRHLSKDPAELQRQVAEKKQALAAEGWSIPARPLPEWQA
jgi:biotin synthase